MQFAKDSFFMALQERLAALNPERTVDIEWNDHCRRLSWWRI